MHDRRDLIANIQMLRGVAALLVVFSHAVDLSAVHTDFAFSLGDQLDRLGGVGVDLFFVISGFIIAQTAFVGTRREAGSFARQRIRRVVPLYFLLSLPWIGIALAQGPVDGGRLAASLLFWPATGAATLSMPYLTVGWTLCFEMLFYGAATLVLLRPRAGVPSMLIAAYAGCWVLREATGLAPFRFLGNPIIIEFLLGVAIAHLWRRVPAAWGGRLVLAGIVSLIATQGLNLGDMAEAPQTMDGVLTLQRLVVWGVPSAAIVLGAVIMRPWSLGWTTAPLMALGAASYSLYLTHGLALHGFGAGLEALGWSWPGPAVLLVGTAVSVPAGLLVYRLIERPLLLRPAGGRRNSKAVLTPRPQPPAPASPSP